MTLKLSLGLAIKVSISRAKIIVTSLSSFLVFKNGDALYWLDEDVVRILVLGSCGKKKLHDTPTQPNCHEINKERDINYWRSQFSKYVAPAREMYTGPQNTELAKAIDLLRTISNVEVQFSIISAGFGLLEEQELVPPYDCSFSNMRMPEVRKRAQELGLSSSFTSLVNRRFELVYLALGKRYLAALGTDSLAAIEIPTITFHGESSKHLVKIPCSAEVVKSFSKFGNKIHGVVGFKGDLLRILARYALRQIHPYTEVKKWTRASYLRRLIYRLGRLEKTD